MNSKVRIKDIAQASGFSIAAVSRALKGQQGLSDETRERILAVAEEAGYDFSRLRSGKIRRLLFLLHPQHNIASALPFYSEIMLGIADECRDSDIAMSFHSVEPGGSLSDLIQLHQPDALICAGYQERELLVELKNTSLPVVLVDLWSPEFPCVNPDNYHGGYIVTRHLIEQGKKQIAFLGQSQKHYSIGQRFSGYQQALADAGLQSAPEYAITIPPVANFERELSLGLEKLLSLPNRPDAIFACNDVSAMIAIRVCGQKGIRVPEDIAIVGFDNIDAAAWTHPPLTTIAVDKRELGRDSFRLLMSDKPERSLLLPVKLIIRESSLNKGE